MSDCSTEFDAWMDAETAVQDAEDTAAAAYDAWVACENAKSPAPLTAEQQKKIKELGMSLAKRIADTEERLKACADLLAR